MIWVKRFLPLVILIAAWFGIDHYRNKQADEYDRLSREQALITARVWYLSARFREEPQTFLILRDSLLVESGVTTEQMHKYLELYNDRPEKYEQFTRLVSYYVDSLCELGHKYQGNRDEQPDSLEVVQPVTQEP